MAINQLDPKKKKKKKKKNRSANELRLCWFRQKNISFSKNFAFYNLVFGIAKTEINPKKKKKNYDQLKTSLVQTIA